MENYSPEKHGIVTAIRIFYEKDRQPMAELTFCFGGTDIIEWTNVNQREKYSKGINGYTFFFDERQKNTFESFKKIKEDEMKAVHFYSMTTNSFEGQGYHMPDFKTFENYALNHMEAIKIADNKYHLPFRDSYICLEDVNFRQETYNQM